MSPEKGASLNLKNYALVSQKYGREGKNCEIFFGLNPRAKTTWIFFLLREKDEGI